MALFKTEANPIGEAVQDESINDFIKIMSAEWDEAKVKTKWYQFWKRGVSFVHVTQFLTKAIDDLIAYVDEYVDEKGPAKKATVMVAVTTLYDYVAHEAMPIFLKPFSPAIKTYIIFGVLSPAIDWVVDKYRNGSWRKEEAAVLKAQWAEKAALL